MKRRLKRGERKKGRRKKGGGKKREEKKKGGEKKCITGDRPGPRTFCMEG